jgi:hypothetical protein
MNGITQGSCVLSEIIWSRKIVVDIVALGLADVFWPARKTRLRLVSLAIPSGGTYNESARRRPMFSCINLHHHGCHESARPYGSSWLVHSERALILTA